jgi:hypothetical protein
MKQKILLAVLLVSLLIISCGGKDPKTLVIVCEDGTITSYVTLQEIPPVIEVKGPCDVYSETLPITIHFPDPDNQSVFAQTGDFFRERYKARLNGTTNKSRIYEILFHSNEVRGAEYLNQIIGSVVIKLK